MPNVNHEILSWARETAELSVDQATQKLQIRDGKKATAKGKLLAYEDGSVAPSRSMLLRMAKAYRKPLLTFYLDKPPLVGDRGEDFRTLPVYHDQENFHIDALIRDIKARQSLAKETLIDEQEDYKINFIGKNTITQNIRDVSEKLTKAINLDTFAFRCQPNYSEAFKYLRHLVEDAGVFVLLQGNLGSHHTNISVSAFRGFALSDDIAPFIVINDRDAKPAQSFTLMHELVHLALGKTGVSGTSFENKIEKFCNDVASEILLPAVEFEKFRPSTLAFETLKDEIYEYATSKKLSSTHISYRLYLNRVINNTLWLQLNNFYQQQWRKQQDKEKSKNKQKDGGPSYYVVKKYKLGALVSMAERFTYSGALSTTKAGFLLNVKPLKVHRLFEINQPV